MHACGGEAGLWDIPASPLLRTRGRIRAWLVVWRGRCNKTARRAASWGCRRHNRAAAAAARHVMSLSMWVSVPPGAAAPKTDGAGPGQRQYGCRGCAVRAYVRARASVLLKCEWVPAPAPGMSPPWCCGATANWLRGQCCPANLLNAVKIIVPPPTPVPSNMPMLVAREPHEQSATQIICLQTTAGGVAPARRLAAFVGRHCGVSGVHSTYFWSMSKARGDIWV